jgi:hypothetical protein
VERHQGLIGIMMHSRLDDNALSDQSSTRDTMKCRDDASRGHRRPFQLTNHIPRIESLVRRPNKSTMDICCDVIVIDLKTSAVSYRITIVCARRVDSRQADARDGASACPNDTDYRSSMSLTYLLMRADDKKSLGGCLQVGDKGLNPAGTCSQ